MNIERLLLVGAIGAAAYFLFKSKLAEAAGTRTYIAPSTGVPTVSNQQGLAVKGGSISYQTGGLDLEVPLDAVKSFFTNLLPGSDKKQPETIQP